MRSRALEVFSAPTASIPGRTQPAMTSKGFTVPSPARTSSGVLDGPVHGEALDPAGEGPDRLARIPPGVGKGEDDALAELGCAGLEADEQLGVVGTGEHRQDEALRLVLTDGQAAGCAERHVVQACGRLEHLATSWLSETALDPCRTRDTEAMDTPAASATV